MFYCYIHGFNSGPESRSGKLLGELLGAPVFCPRNDYSKPFETCLAQLEEQISQEAGAEPVCLLGASLGGFYALQLRLARTARVAAWNPVIFPALQLAQFAGENIRFTDNQKWHFGREAQLSYARALDPRLWENMAWQSRFNGNGPACPERKIFLGNADQVLDHELSLVYWQGYAPLEVIASEHSIADFGHARSFLLAEKGTGGC